MICQVRILAQLVITTVLFSCYYYYPHGTEVSEAKSIYVTCLRSHRCQVGELGYALKVELLSSDTES